MVKRWLIRSLCLLPLACVVGVWVTSYFGQFIWHDWLDGRGWEVNDVRGLVYVSEDPGSRFRMHLHYESLGPLMSGNMDWNSVTPTLGFYCGTVGSDDYMFGIIFPLWLPTLLLLGLNWFVWRKTRVKYNERGFPVEPAKDATKAK